MAKVLVIHGAGMNMRGKVNIETFGPMTLDQYDAAIQKYAEELKTSVETFHSNIEGEVVNRLYRAHDDKNIDAAIINPSAFSNGYPALVAAIGQVRFPSIEVHVSNPAARGGSSQVGGACKGTIAGFGIFGYYLALQAALNLIKPK
jgi:3-dehydroquinate dehydratase-2